MNSEQSTTMSTLSNNPFDDSSQTSRGSALNGSLLARIQASREAAARSEEQVVVPNYSHVSTQEIPSTRSSSWNISWPRFSNAGSNTHEATESLLQNDADPDVTDDTQQYSMMRYFQTFVQDIYNLFRSMHPFVQGVSIVAVFYQDKSINCGS